MRKYLSIIAAALVMMIKACTSTDEDNYWFDKIWSKSPVYEAPAE